MPEKGTTTLRTRVCKQCGSEFSGGPRAWYCPDCRHERQREQARRFREKKAKGLVDRPLGSLDKCEVCGREYSTEKEIQVRFKENHKENYAALLKLCAENSAIVVSTNPATYATVVRFEK